MPAPGSKLVKLISRFGDGTLVNVYGLNKMCDAIDGIIDYLTHRTGEATIGSRKVIALNVNGQPGTITVLTQGETTTTTTPTPTA